MTAVCLQNSETFGFKRLFFEQVAAGCNLRGGVPWICCRTDIDVRCAVARVSPCHLTDKLTLDRHHESSRALLKPEKRRQTDEHKSFFFTVADFYGLNHSCKDVYKSLINQRQDFSRKKNYKISVNQHHG